MSKSRIWQAKNKENIIKQQIKIKKIQFKSTGTENKEILILSFIIFIKMGERL